MPSRRFLVAAMIEIACILQLQACRRGSQVSRSHPSAPQVPRSSGGESRGQKIPPLPVGYTEEGVASWYGVPYHGRPAADGEIYDMETLVAAHRTMPFNTRLRVTNVRNGKTVEVRVIDRGPFVGNRIIDLSKAAARQLELLGPGTGTVRLEVISAPPDIRSNDFYSVQAGAFSVYDNAERARAGYAARFGTAQLSVKQGTAPLYRVLVGKLGSTAAAQALADQLRSETGSGVFIVRLDQTVPTIGTPTNPPPPSHQ